MASNVGRRTRRPARSSGRSMDEEPEALELDVVDVEVEDLNDDNPTKNIILYGPSGGGKTVLALGAPNCTVVAMEPGYVSAKSVGHSTGLIKAPTWAHVNAAIKKCDQLYGPEDWVVWDSITKMQYLNIRWILDSQHAKKASRDEDIPAVQDHQKWQNMYVRYINRIIDAPYNSILIATSMMKEDEDGEDIVMPNILGKGYAIAETVMETASHVLYYAVSKTASTEQETVRRILAQPYPPYRAKDRYGTLGKRIDVREGNYNAMADIIQSIETMEPYYSQFEAELEAEEEEPRPRVKKRRVRVA